MMKLFSSCKETPKCVYMKNWLCETCMNKDNHWCEVIEHNIHTGQTKACIEMFAIPPHFKRELQDSGVFQQMENCRKICMIFSTEKGENTRECLMRCQFMRYNIGCKLFATIPLKKHIKKGYKNNCRRFWRFMVDALDKKCQIKGHHMFKQIFDR